MLLKKQTVWLLTMLSLVVVLSVYYVTSPDAKNGNVAFDPKTEEKEDMPTATDKEDGTSVTINEEDGTAISSISSDEMFTALRLQIDEDRSKLMSELKSIVASKDVPAEQKSQAMDDLKKLEEIKSKEATLEILIKGQGFEDALVRADGDKVRITVKAKETNATDANDILRLVRSELGDIQDVAVKFEPTTKK